MKAGPHLGLDGVRELVQLLLVVRILHLLQMDGNGCVGKSNQNR